MSRRLDEWIRLHRGRPEIAHMIRLRGAKRLSSGFNRKWAFAIGTTDLTLEDVPRRWNLEEGLAYLNEKLRNALKESPWWRLQKSEWQLIRTRILS